MMIIYSWSFCPQKDGKCCTHTPTNWEDLSQIFYWHDWLCNHQQKVLMQEIGRTGFFSENILILFFPPTCKNKTLSGFRDLGNNNF
jgi:hypothetical protein